MGKISLRAKQERAFRKVAETLEKTVIHQRQSSLILGRWDFVVFGPSLNKKEAVLRIGVAEQAFIQRASVYVASIGDPAILGQSGMMTIEELTDGDISEELRGLEVYHVSPLRPINIIDKRKGPDLDRMREQTLEEFSGANTAIIETPDQEAWSLSALKYLHQCDENLPDPVMLELRSRMRDTSMTFGGSGEIIH